MSPPIVMEQVRITGKVQGVYFRKTLRQEALALGLRGWCRNGEDGISVEALLVGAADGVESLLQWCKQGPPNAKVEAVQHHRLSPPGLPRDHLAPDFVIRYD